MTLSAWKQSHNETDKSGPLQAFEFTGLPGANILQQLFFGKMFEKRKYNHNRKNYLFIMS